MPMDKIQEDFLAQTSLELQDMMSEILRANATLLADPQAELPEHLMEQLRAVQASSQKMSALIDNLVQGTRLNGQKLKLTIETVTLRPLVESAIEQIRRLADRQTVHFINKIQADFPDVKADPHRLSQIVFNLIKILLACVQKAFVEVSARHNDGTTTLVISATGDVHDEYLDPIIAQSAQTEDMAIEEDTQRVFSYVISRQLIEAHGANLHINTIPEKAVRFSFKLPLAQPTAASDEPPSSATPPAKAEGEATPAGSTATNDHQNPFKILIVDDEPTVCQFLTQYLSMMDYDIVTATNGNDALSMIHNGERPDLVLLDVMMPEIDGFEVCRRIRQQFKANELPIILLTSRDQIKDVVLGFDVGANDYVSKPFSNSELAARIKTHLQLSHINAAYSRFVPREFLRLLGHDSIVSVKLGEQIQSEMTIFFGDIRSFTTLSENMTPRENFEFLNSYLTRVSPVIWKYKGFIDKYIGDAMMALFPNDAEDALSAAIEMMDVLKIYNTHRQKSGYKPIKVGIGLHTGPVILGTIGYSEYMQGTVISDAVNLASRIENLTKLYGAKILISEQTLFHLRQAEKYQYRFLDLVRVKGKKHSISVFEIFNVDDQTTIALKQKTRDDFEQGVYLFHSKKFKEAHDLFKKVIDINKEDPAARLYISRCDQFIEGGVPEDWDGVATQNEKL